MSSLVCQGLQSCLEPRVVEPRALRPKIVTTKSHFLKPTTSWAESLLASDSESDTDNNDKKEDANSEADMGGWSFMQTLTMASSIRAKEDQGKKAYVHPLYKRSASQLSTKSLELCTETLGSETGSDIGDDIDISLSSSDSESNKSPTKERSRSRLRNALNYKSLPPPLTSISGSNCYTIKPHREGGRLVMKAVVVPTPNTCFQAERRDGRLKLHYIKNSSDSSDSSESSDSEQEAQGEEEEEEEEDYLDGNSANVGKGTLQRPSRCNEGGRGKSALLTWEPFWVAT